MTLVVGLTGGIGSGKSAAADAFAACGAAIIDTDVIARELTAPHGAAMATIRATFGDALITPNGALDRVAMRKLVFAEPSQRIRLEALLHPLIRTESENRLRRLAGADFPYAVLVVPLLVENPRFMARADRICVVDCTDELCIARVMTRSGLARPEVLAIMATQVRREQRLAVADDVIDNAGSLAELTAQVVLLDAKYRQFALSRQAEGDKSGC